MHLRLLQHPFGRWRVVLAISLCAARAFAAAPEFDREVAPILVNHCLDCHQPDKKSGELDISTSTKLLAGGEQGAALNPGKPAESLLIQRIEAGEMPPDDAHGIKPLVPAQVAVLRSWIESGAPWPKDRTLGVHEKQVDLEGQRGFWSFQPVRLPDMPVAAADINASANRAANAIDAFILDKLAGNGLTMSRPADRSDLLRRMSLDVRGLPPTLDEQELFLKDESPDAVERLADRLLSDPAYGERWSRHWLDLVRYADSNGYERDSDKPSVWRYRDYVIDALNSDKPYDRFVVEQLAGDEFPSPTPETIIATGFHALGTWQDEVDPLEAPQYRADELDDMIRTTSQTLLGVTIGCARCHNHKFDPLTMADYYSLSAILAPLKRPNEGRTDRDRLAITPAQLQQSPVPDAPRAYFLYEDSPNAPVTHLLLSGRASNPGAIMQPQVPVVLTSVQPEFTPVGKHTTGRRLTFARWVATADNPLASRVMVNRLWQHHFGTGLVSTPSDFGNMGARPTHPELLDWLAYEFTHDAQWSMKRIHRLILGSETYQQASVWDSASAAKDSENKLLWRYPYHRLDAESIRDSMLQVAGNLDRTMHGPAVKLPIPLAAIEAHTDKEAAWKADGEPATNRRTVYAYVKRTLLVPMLETLDFCDTTQTSDVRPVTSVATQALTLYNGDFANRQAEVFSDRLLQETPESAVDQVELAYRLALARPPSAAEQQAVGAFRAREAAEQRGAGTDPPTAGRAALVQVCRMILNLDEFVYPN
jgi:hypothetical protein